MENYNLLLKNSQLFDHLTDEEIEKLYKCFNASVRSIDKDAFVFRAGDDVQWVYLILSGSMYIVDEDFWGNRSIIETIENYTFFGEAYIMSTAEKHLVSVIAAENSTYLQIDPVKLLKTCPNECACHHKLIENVAHILSEKIVRLTEKLGHISQRTMQEKVLSYLSKCARQAGSNSFYIPYSRQQLADFLCVDRSALSHELSKLQKAEMIKYNKNYFELLL